MKVERRSRPISRTAQRRITLRASLLAAVFLCSTPAAAEAQNWLAFRSSLGHEWLTAGDLSEPLHGDTRTEWSVLLVDSLQGISGRIRLGAGISRITYDMNHGWESVTTRRIGDTHSPRWNHVGWHVLFGLELRRPYGDVYVERRRIWGRLRSQTHVKWEISADPTPSQKHTPYDEWAVGGWETVFGFKTDFGGACPVYLDISYRQGDLKPRNATTLDMSAYGLGVRHSALMRGLQIGVYWTM